VKYGGSIERPNICWASTKSLLGNGLLLHVIIMEIKSDYTKGILVVSQ